MKLSELHPTYREALAHHEAFRRLRFPAEDIYVGLARTPTTSQEGKEQGMIKMVVKKAGTSEEFICEVGHIDWDPNFGETWAEAAELWNRGATEEERRDVWESSFVLKHSTKLVASLVMKGFCRP